MKIVVLGAGVIGVSTAYYLAAEGHEVVVIDRQPGPALETSYANAGEISAGYAAPWAAPGIPTKVLGWLFKRHAPLVWRPKADLEMMRWLIAMLGNCSESRYIENKSRLLRLAEYSRSQMQILRARTGIQYDQRTQGTLQLFREREQFDAVAKDISLLKADGVPYEVLDRAGCIAVEPGLAQAIVPIVGGLRLPNDETGDCFKFTNALADIAASTGATFHYDVPITSIDRDGDRISCIRAGGQFFIADAYVLALGSYSPKFGRAVGVRLPIYPVKGYSITVPIANEEVAPQSTVIDDSYKVAVTRLGDRIRVAGTAEISGYSTSLPVQRREIIETTLRSLYPNAGDVRRSEFWSGLRPMTPDTTPIIGRTHIANLFTNTGHGTYGWTMACGSARVLADIIAERETGVRSDDLSVGRYG